MFQTEQEGSFIYLEDLKGMEIPVRTYFGKAVPEVYIREWLEFCECTCSCSLVNCIEVRPSDDGDNFDTVNLTIHMDERDLPMQIKRYMSWGERPRHFPTW